MRGETIQSIIAATQKSDNEIAARVVYSIFALFCTRDILLVYHSDSFIQL